MISSIAELNLSGVKIVCSCLFLLECAHDEGVCCVSPQLCEWPGKGYSSQGGMYMPYQVKMLSSDTRLKISRSGMKAHSRKQFYQ